MGESELSFTLNKISANLSNYSAWHSRSALLAESITARETAEEELQLAQQGIMTEPKARGAAGVNVPALTLYMCVRL